VLVDYNQNRWGSTLASIYSVRPQPLATVSTPVTWDEVARGVKIEDFRLDNVRERIDAVGDLWKPLVAARGRADLDLFLSATQKPTRSNRKSQIRNRK
jgi:bifunctional non-homologous end joining protein LigD